MSLAFFFLCFMHGSGVHEEDTEYGVPTCSNNGKLGFARPEATAVLQNLLFRLLNHDHLRQKV